MFVRPDGTGVRFHAVKMRPKRRRGKRLTDTQVRRVSDLVYVLLLDSFGLSPTDVERVLDRRLRHAQRADRRNRVAARVDKQGIFPLLSEVIKDAG